MKYIAILVFSLLANGVLAQNGTIRATVFDGDSGEGMIGATALVKETSQGAITDLDGKATIDKLAPGNYTLQVSFIGYKTYTIENIEVKAGEIKTFTILLMENIQEIEEVVVVGEAVRNFETAILTLQRKSPVVLDAITSDVFSRNGDNDAASAVKRVVGVTIQGGKYVYVRGLGDRYSKTLLNGAEVPGVDPNKNSVQLDMFPTNLLDNILVYKTFSPDLPGSFSGGLVNVTTKDFPDRFTFQVSGSLGFNNQANFNSNFLNYKGSKTDWLGFDNGYRDIPNQLKGYTQENFPSPSRIGLPGPTGAPITRSDIDAASKAFTNREFSPNQESQINNHNLSISVGNQIPLLSKQFGFLAGLTYRRSFEFYDNGKVNRYSGITGAQNTLNNDLIYSLNDSRGTDEVNIGALANGTIKLNDNNKVGLNLLYNQNGSQDTRYLEGYRLDNVPDSTEIFQSRVLQYTERNMFNAQLKGEHVIPAWKNAEINWISSYSNSSMNQPDLRFLANAQYIENPDNPFYRVSNVSRPGRYFRSLQETNSDNKLNFVFPLSLFEREAKLKTGLNYTYKDRTFTEDRYEYFVNPNTFSGNVDDIFLEEKLGVRQDNSYGTTLELFTQKPNNYTAEQTVYATYLMVESPLSEKLKLVAGARYEQTEQSIEAKSGATGEIKTSDILPAINTTYAIDNNANLRFSYSRTLARPSFREFAPLVTFGFYGDFDQVGNPDLKRTLIDNFDFRWEKFPIALEYVGVSLFYKNFKNPIENTQNPGVGGSALEFKYENVEKATVAGVEVDYRKKLDFIAAGLSNYRISVNASYIYSKVSLSDDEYQFIQAFDPEASDTRKMYNTSPYVLNTALYYDNKESGWSSNITFNVFGKRLSVFSTSLPFVYEKPRPDLNFSIKKSFNERLSMRFRANNILNSAYKESMDYKDQEFIYNTYKKGASFSFSLNYLIE